MSRIDGVEPREGIMEHLMVSTSTYEVHLCGHLLGEAVDASPTSATTMLPRLTMTFNTISRNYSSSPSFMEDFISFAPSSAAMLRADGAWERQVGEMLCAALSRYNPPAEEVRDIVRSICDYCHDALFHRFPFPDGRAFLLNTVVVLPPPPIIDLTAICGLERRIYGGGDDLDHAEQAGETRTAAKTSTSTSCAICLEEYEVGVEIVEMPPCGHRFHSRCMSEWVVRSPTCPFCRVPFPIRH